MKVYHISTIAVLTILLSFISPITWADKKTVIIAGSAGGAAAAAIGGTLWYKLNNYNRIIAVEFDGEPVNFNLDDQDVLVKALEEKRLSEEASIGIKDKFYSDIKRISKISKKAHIKLLLTKEGEAIKFTIQVNDQFEDLHFIDAETGEATDDINFIEIPELDTYVPANNDIQSSVTSAKLDSIATDQELTDFNDSNRAIDIENDVADDA